MTRDIARALSHHRWKWVVLALWIGLLVFGGVFGSKLTDAQNNEAASWLPGDAESTKALEELTAFQPADTIDGLVVYHRDGGLTSADRQAATEDAAEFAELDGIVGEVQGPQPSEDGESLRTQLRFDLGENGWTRAPGISEDIHQIADQSGGPEVYLTGLLGQAADSAEAFEGIDGTLLFATLGVVIVLLLLTYRSPVLWALPIFSAVTALLAAQGAIYLLAEHAGLVVNGQSAGILTVLVIGAGTDYALLLVARYREELRVHEDRHEAMTEALHRAGPAILASGGTVILGMLCLLAATMNSTQGLGPVAAIGVTVALVAMTTLLPALLVIFGRWVFWPQRPHHGSEEPTVRGLWARVGRAIAPRPRLVWAATTVLLGAAWFGLPSLDANGLTTAESYRGTPESVQGAEVQADHFPGDAANAVQVLAPADKADQAAAVLGSTAGIARDTVTPPFAADGIALITGQLTDESLTPAAFATIDRLRQTLDTVGDDVLVVGNDAVALDVKNASQRDNEVVIPLILAVVLLILVVLLRAVVAPVLLIATVVLSFGTALGLSALVFTHVFDFGGADSAFPLFVFVFLVALGIDYNIFLMTRVREEALDHGTRPAALIGLRATGGVITSAGLVLAATFAVLATLPLTFLTQLGFAVALGVLLDTIVVRSVLVTALNLDLGRLMWWPSRLWHKPDDLAAMASTDPAEVLTGSGGRL